jgi:hypothetical protein
MASNWRVASAPRSVLRRFSWRYDQKIWVIMTQAKISRPEKRVSDPVGSYGEDLLDKTIGVWQPYTPDRILTREDAREIIVNMTGFFVC